MKTFKVLAIGISIFSVMIISGCNLEDKSMSQVENSDKGMNSNSIHTKTIPANNSTNVKYIIDDGADIINNQHIEQNVKKTVKK